MTRHENIKHPDEYKMRDYRTKEQFDNDGRLNFRTKIEIKKPDQNKYE